MRPPFRTGYWQNYPEPFYPGHGGQYPVPGWGVMPVMAGPAMVGVGQDPPSGFTTGFVVGAVIGIGLTAGLGLLVLIAGGSTGRR